MRTAIGLLALGIAGGVIPVGSSVAQYLAPLLTGTLVAFVVLLTLCLAASAIRRGRARDLEAASSRLAARVPTPVRSAAPRTT
jgi:nitrate/nitrite transporter NarK